MNGRYYSTPGNYWVCISLLFIQRGDMIKNRYIKVSVYFCELEVLQWEKVIILPCS